MIFMIIGDEQVIVTVTMFGYLCRGLHRYSGKYHVRLSRTVLHRNIFAVAELIV